MTTAKKTGVIGWPISHTKSPLIHGHWLAKYGIAGSYEAIPIEPENLPARVAELVKEGYAGFNVTVPHKQAIMPLLDSVSDGAKRIGAVNTVVINNGKLEGRNTDAFGFIENLRANAAGFDFARGAAVVLGAGGAARAVVYALLDAGVPEVYIANRTRARADALAASFPPARACDWAALPDIMAGANLLVNTTSLGMKGQPPLDLDITTLPQTALVNDIVYAPLETDYLRMAASRGHKTVTGIGMLLHQARPAFEAWYGVLPDVDAALAQKVLA